MTVLEFILPALIIALISLPLVKVFTGKVDAKSAKFRLATHVCGFFAVVLGVFLFQVSGTGVFAEETVASGIAEKFSTRFRILSCCFSNWYVSFRCWDCRSCRGLLLQSVLFLKTKRTLVNH